MMKKTAIYSLILLAGISLAACGGKTQSSESSASSKQTEKNSTTSSSTKESTTKSSASSSSTKATSTEPKTSETQTAAQPENNTPEKQATTVLDELGALFPNDRLPQRLLTSRTATYLTAATTGTADQNNFRVLYYAEDHPIAVNDPAVNNLQPIASFEKKTYGSAEEAAAGVEQVIDTGGNKVDLGYGITGYEQGAAGSTYLSWQEGNWSLVVRASNIGGEVAEPLAKEVVTYLEKAMLPAPKNIGQISLTASVSDSYQINSAAWQKDTIVYTVKHFDALQTVKMAVSTNE
jgi:hypothetical protein